MIKKTQLCDMCGSEIAKDALWIRLWHQGVSVYRNETQLIEANPERSDFCSRKCCTEALEVLWVPLQELRDHPYDRIEEGGEDL